GDRCRLRALFRRQGDVGIGAAAGVDEADGGGGGNIAGVEVQLPLQQALFVLGDVARKGGAAGGEAQRLERIGAIGGGDVGGEGNRLAAELRPAVEAASEGARLEGAVEAEASAAERPVRQGAGRHVRRHVEGDGAAAALGGAGEGQRPLGVGG